MGSGHRFRFGVQVHSARDGKAWAETARRAEAYGYSTLAVPDHFSEQPGPITALALAAAATESLRVTALVFDNDYRHPAVLAKEAATLDLLSGGRTDFGLGAGWQREDYERTGIPYDPIGVRMDRMVEGLAVIKGLFAGGRFSFQGRHYTINGLEGAPLPLQKPHPPVMIGGGGRRMLSIAAREADIVNINFDLRAGMVDPGTVRSGTAAATDQKVAWIRGAAADRFDHLELSTITFVAAVTDDRQAMASTIAAGIGSTAEEVLEVPHFLIGTLGQIEEDLVRRRERYGITYVFVPGTAMEAFAPVVARLTGT